MRELRLPPTTDSVPKARRFAREELRESGADIDTVVLLVSEVVTNAVLHARSDLLLVVGGDRETARVEVHDSSSVPVRMHRFAPESATGRGLRLLDVLAQRWGTDRLEDGGKVVWFEVGPVRDEDWESVGHALLAEGATGDA